MRTTKVFLVVWLFSASALLMLTAFGVGFPSLEKNYPYLFIMTACLLMIDFISNDKNRRKK